VCPENFANRPTAALVDVRKRLTVLSRQLSRLTRIDTLAASLPEDLTVDLAVDNAGIPQRPAGELLRAVRRIEARYAPECLDTCELCRLCRDEATDDTAALGRVVRDELGGVDSVGVVLGLAEGTLSPAAERVEAADLLRLAARLRAEALAGAA